MTPAKKLLSYSYYPGCSLHASAKEYDESTRGLFKALGIGLKEVPDWLCCGATPAHNVDELLSLSLCAKNLSLAEGVEGDLAVACAACFSRLKVTQHHLADNETKRKQVEYAIAGAVNLQKPVKHLLEILAKDFGLDRLTEAVQKPLSGLKVACYYGCLLTRPPEVPELDCVEAPTIMERVIGAVGAETVRWSHRMECCGANFTLSRPGVVLKLSGSILDSAKAAGADCLMVACPLCHGNLDIRQKEIEEATGERFGMPVFYMTQLLALAVGVAPGKLGFDSMIVNPLPLLKEKGLV
ncbi:CoB--CoM heterodisulfide reductase iron-sulfur subunit B family protein [Geobacter hydrogenophilus]|uniref:Heterodisulfide reductase subunit B n=1 Tax=Geobacter hydrogenophilus TaxID=40983 RepID=A0A9W6LCM2_9BACT|nr:CoB--CoM heterodisulfide reductase iron-sulfur subunit B family protein [Geobacter hydrogenophilus]MBT0893386.1 CoB--CoM heterodisulfide reductase iron-sulfur subunit B family protein [Geobacter hydrogenophilus]GLI37919.1 heterodisulfide reductase subunit B [Geobacter hydrogenophilus]